MYMWPAIHYYMPHASCPKSAGYLICIIPLANGTLKQYRRLMQINIIIRRSSLSSLCLCNIFRQNTNILNRSVSALLQLECVEHLEADFPDVIFILVTDLLQNVADGIKHFLSILEIWAAAVQHGCGTTHTLSTYTPCAAGITAKDDLLQTHYTSRVFHISTNMQLCTFKQERILVCISCVCVCYVL